MNKVFLMVGCLAVACCAANSYASEQTGVIEQIYKRDSDGLLFIRVAGARTAKPSCATYNYFMLRDEASNNGKQQLAMLLMAKASGQTITIIGAGSCTRWSDGEDINVVIL